MAQTRAVRSRAVSSALHLAKKQACPETAERACPETADRAPPRALRAWHHPAHGTHQTAASEQQANDNQTDRSAEEGNNRIRSYQSEA